MSRIHKEILETLQKFLQQNPEQRFTQALFNLGVNEFVKQPENVDRSQLRDVYNDSDEDVLQRMKSQLQEYGRQEEQYLPTLAYLDQHVFYELTDLNNGFDTTTKRYFSGAEFEIVLERANEQGLSVNCIEIRVNGVQVGVGFGRESYDYLKPNASENTLWFADFHVP